MNWQVKKLTDFFAGGLSPLDRQGKVDALMLSLTDLDVSINKAAVIVSRLPLRWNSEDSWLDAIRRAVSHVGMNNHLLVTSTGSSGWDYIAWYAGRIGLPRIVITPSVNAAQANLLASQALASLDLQPAATCFIAPITRQPASRAEKFHIRDQLVAGLADVVYPAAIRPGGFWQEFLETARNVDSQFLIEYPRKRESTRWNNLQKSREGDLFQWSDYYIHLTRGAYGPWPGERTADYFSALTGGKAGNPRDEPATLSYILYGGILRGSGVVIREAAPVISFSSSNPYDLLRFGTTRARIHGLAYQPFGIAVKKEILLDLGARPVIYGGDEDYRLVPEAERVFFQHQGRNNKANQPMGWEGECEIRLPGDLDLLSMKEHITAFVPTAQFAQHLSEQTGFMAIHLFMDDNKQ